MVNKKTELDKRRGKCCFNVLNDCEVLWAETQAEMAQLLIEFQSQKKAFEKAKEATLTKKAEFDKFDLEDRQVTEKIQGIKKEGKKAKKALKRVTHFLKAAWFSVKTKTAKI